VGLSTANDQCRVGARDDAGDSARAVLASVKAHAATEQPLPRRTLPEAYVQLLLKDIDGSFESLAAQLQVAPQSRVEVAALLWFLPLHKDPRFRALVTPPARSENATSR